MANRPRGTRDFGPDEMAARTWAAACIRDVFRRFAFHEVQTPTFEELELFTAKSGDGIISELYNFEDKGKRKMTLRPELTAPVMRMYFQDHAFDPKPLKWFYHGSCFRYDRPQEGRYREFWQFGCEQIGAGTPLAYAELIALGASCFEALGLKDVEIRVGHVDLLGRMVTRIMQGYPNLDRKLIMRTIDKEDWAALEAHLGGAAPPEVLAGFRKIISSSTIAEAIQHWRNWDQSLHLSGGGAMEPMDWEKGAQVTRLNELKAVFNHLENLGITPTLNLGIARGLDYYTGVVFEFHCKELEAQSQLLGGGGYDLSHLFGGAKTDTMGFGLGFDRTLVALEKQGVALPIAAGPVAYFGALGEAAQAVVVETVTQLRKDGVPVDMDLLGRKPDKITKAATAVGARLLVILGDRDLESGQVRIKDLVSGESRSVSLADLVHEVRAGSRSPAGRP